MATATGLLVLSTAQAALIKGMLRRKDRSDDIARYFGVPVRRINDIRAGYQFKDVKAAQTSRLPVYQAESPPKNRRRMTGMTTAPLTSMEDGSTTGEVKLLGNTSGAFKNPALLGSAATRAGAGVPTRSVLKQQMNIAIAALDRAAVAIGDAKAALNAI